MLSKFSQNTSQSIKKLVGLQKFQKADTSAYLYKKGGAHDNLFNYSERESDLLKTTPLHFATPTVRPTKQREAFSNKECNSTRQTPAKNDWKKDWEPMNEEEAVREAQRCLKCTDAPCQKGCSTSIDIKTFIYCIEQKNWYGAAKTILSDNPVAVSCGLLCPVSKLCAGPCNMFFSEDGPIKINHLQDKALKVFKSMGVKQIRDPSLPTNLPKSYDSPIALIGCGPASISCATFLARLGYKNVHVFEKEQIGGGLVTTEIPKNRSSQTGMEFEINLMTDLGVKIHYGKSLGKDFTLEQLKSEGYKAVFLGSGLPQPQKNLGNIYDIKGVYNSKTFLPPICYTSKNIEKNIETPDVQGKHVLVIGIGDTALDCARSAYRCGASRVSVIFRRGFNDLRANDEIFLPAFYDGCNFIPYSNPTEVIQDSNGQVIGVKFQQNSPNKEQKYQKSETEAQVIGCDVVVTAFGAEITESWVQELINKKNGKVYFNENTMQTPVQHIFAGGDICGTANLVDAVNDGKTASWYMHKYLQELAGETVPQEPQLPGFFTEIDQVDLTTEIAGIKIPNPYGLASAPPATSYPMIKRAFEAGWGFAVTKTFVLDKDTVTNISPRIYKSTNNSTKKEASFANIELVTEKSAAYWIEGCKETKEEFPEHVIVASIMCQYNQKDWVELTKKCESAPFDCYELNLSCPHGMGEFGMGRATGENPATVKQITEWVCGATKKPVFVKITPNWAYADELAIAAQEGGAAGVTLTNTMPSLMDPQADGNPWPRVGQEQKVAFGGACGSVLRPFALKKCAEVAANPKYTGEIFGSGGVVSADHALSFIQYGAKALQLASAVMDQDAGTCIYNLNTGLRAHLYLSQRIDLSQKGWTGATPPANYNEQQVTYQKVDLRSVPSIVGVAKSQTHHISSMSSLEKDILIPKINDDLCLKCGRCYLTCADNGYQAFKFDNHNMVPELQEDKCTGCALCHAVCPVPGTIEMVPMNLEYHIKRGIFPTEPQLHAQHVIKPRHVRNSEAKQN